MSRFIEEIDKALREGGDRPAFVQGDQTWTCREAERLVSVLEQWIVDHCHPGDRVAGLTQNRVEAVLLEWATYRAGCIWLGIPARERDAGSLARLLADFGPRLLLLERFGPYGEISLPAESFTGRDTVPPPGLDPVRFRTLLRLDRDREDGVEFLIGEEPIRRLRYSSGSAGEPKAVAYTDRTLSAMLDMISESVLEDGAWTVVHGLPITWASGSLIAPALCRGGKSVILDAWDPERFTRAVAREEHALSLLTPGLLAVLARYSETNGTAWARSLDRVLLAGGPTPVWTMRRAWKLFTPGTEFVVTLGQTEASFPITWHPVVEEDVAEGKRGPAVVPLGPFSRHYRGSTVSSSGEILLVGDAVAPGRWVSPDGNAGGCFELFEKPHRTGDRGRKKGQVIHYLGRVSDRWRRHRRLPPAEAVEAVLNACPGVSRSRVDSMRRRWGRIRTDVTLKPADRSLSVPRVREYFRTHQREARLSSVRLRRVRLGEVETTLSGKIRRSTPGSDGDPPPPAASDGSPRRPGGAGVASSRAARSWREFDFSRIATGALYYYVGAGLSMEAGLASWSEMVCLIWAYRERFEGRNRPRCPPDDPAELEKYLDRFVREHTKRFRPWTPRILSHRSGDDPGEWRALGRTALLNMLLRYRGPRGCLVPQKGRAQLGTGPPRSRPGEEPSHEDLMIHSMIWRSRCHGVFTTNYDMLLEHAFSLFHYGGDLRSYRYSADFLRFVLSNPHFVLKLHGDINDIATMEFCPGKAWRRGGLSRRNGRGEDLKRAYASALDRGHMIYLGCGFRDATIRKLHRSWKASEESSSFCRVGLLRRDELDELIESGRATEFTERGIELLSFEDFFEVREFMKVAVSARSGARERWSACPEATDLHQQLFLSWDPTAAKRNYWTESWSCKGVPRRM